MAPQPQRILEHIALLDVNDLTCTRVLSCSAPSHARRSCKRCGCGDVACRACATWSGNVSTHALSALISSNGTETVEIVRRVKSDA